MLDRGCLGRFVSINRLRDFGLHRDLIEKVQSRSGASRDERRRGPRRSERSQMSRVDEHVWCHDGTIVQDHERTACLSAEHDRVVTADAPAIETASEPVAPKPNLLTFRKRIEAALGPKTPLGLDAPRQRETPPHLSLDLRKPAHIGASYPVIAPFADGRQRNEAGRSPFIVQLAFDENAPTQIVGPRVATHHARFDFASDPETEPFRPRHATRYAQRPAAPLDAVRRAKDVGPSIDCRKVIHGCRTERSCASRAIGSPTGARKPEPDLIGKSAGTADDGGPCQCA